MKKEKRKTITPAWIRQKLIAAVSMMLVAMIMLVSSTYAWFTLSTAPEVTGITTSVGANGNLEIALLNDDTFLNLASITSASGDSFDGGSKTKTQANITWGNLIDLSDNTYGLSTITLLPAKINENTGVLGASLLQTPIYGADGRVAKLEGNTVSAIYDGTKFGYTDGNQSYGVRAVGVASDLSKAQMVFNAIKADFASKTNGVQRSAANAINANAGQFIAIALAGEVENYTEQQVAALLNVADGLKASLETLVAVYSDAAIAAAVSTASKETQETVATLVEPYIGNTNTAVFTQELGALKAHVGSYASKFTDLEKAINAVEEAIESINDACKGETQDTVKITAACNSLIGASGTWTYESDASGVYEANTLDALKATMDGSIYITGVFQTIADFTGSFKLTEVLGVTVNGGASVTVANKSTVTGAVNTLAAPAGATSTNITDFYGYVIDFAFRTNAADSFLQLQTEAANRVYSDATGSELATQGAGSYVEFAYDGNMPKASAEKLLGCVKVIFFDPSTNSIMAKGKVTPATTADGTLRGAISLVVQEGADTDNIVALTQNQAKKVSVLVYLDGETVQNSDVINAASSGTFTVNLQFSSSATLVPMNNTELRQRTKK